MTYETSSTFLSPSPSPSVPSLPPYFNGGREGRDGTRFNMSSDAGASAARPARIHAAHRTAPARTARTRCAAHTPARARRCTHPPAPAARIRPHPSPTPPACPTDRPRTPPPARGLQTPMTLRHRSPSLPVSREAKKHQVVRLSQSLTHVHVAVILIMDMLETAHLYCK
jgi:hypothetical protein